MRPAPAKSPLLAAAGRFGRAKRYGDPVAISEAARDLATERIAAFAQEAIAGAHSLTDEQRDRIDAVLRGGR